jgi:hypothetical protein
MTQAEVIEGNKLIADSPFAPDIVKTNISHYVDSGNEIGLVKYYQALNFDWNMLMQVVVNLENKGIGFEVDPWGIVAVEFLSGNEEDIFQFINDDNYLKIIQYYTTIVESIKWYNKNIKNHE